MPKFHVWECLAFPVLAAFAVYAAVEPMAASADDCISAVEILLLFPYYVLLYFGTLPVLVAAAVRRIAVSARMTARDRRRSEITIGALCLLLLLEILAGVDSPYSAVASRCLDWMPFIVLSFCTAWRCVQSRQTGLGYR
jgi:hypothetical protein